MNALADRNAAPVAAGGAPLVNATRFRAAHEADWRRLDALLTRIEKRSVRVLDADDLLALPLLYRTALSSLAVVRETSLDRALATYLEQLCTRAYFQLYGVPTSFADQLRHYLFRGWPAAVAALWRETLFTFALLIVGTLAGYLLVRGDPSWYYAILPDGLAGGRTPDASAEALRATIYAPRGRSDHDGLAVFAAFLFTHNSQVSIFAFALGFIFAVPTVLLLLYNGLTLGAMLAVFVPKGLGVGFGGWLAIHGTTELFAITLAGAAGTRIGTALAFPGRRARLDAMVAAGRAVAPVMCGVVVMLLVAGILEGIGRQTIQDDSTRYAIGLAMLGGWLAYFYLPRRRETRDALADTL